MYYFMSFFVTFVEFFLHLLSFFGTGIFVEFFSTPLFSFFGYFCTSFLVTFVEFFVPFVELFCSIPWNPWNETYEADLSK